MGLQWVSASHKLVKQVAENTNYITVLPFSCITETSGLTVLRNLSGYLIIVSAVIRVSIRISKPHTPQYCREITTHSLILVNTYRTSITRRHLLGPWCRCSKNNHYSNYTLKKKNTYFFNTIIIRIGKKLRESNPPRTLQMRKSYYQIACMPDAVLFYFSHRLYGVLSISHLRKAGILRPGSRPQNLYPSGQNELCSHNRPAQPSAGTDPQHHSTQVQLLRDSRVTGAASHANMPNRNAPVFIHEIGMTIRLLHHQGLEI